MSRGAGAARRGLGSAVAFLIVLAVVVALLNRSSSPAPGFSVTRRSPPANAFDAALTSWVWLEFDRPVNRESVERNLRLTPAVKGRFVWGETAVAFVPDSNLEPNIPYTVTLGEKATSLRGRPLGRASNWRFRTIPKDRLNLAEPLNPGVSMTFARVDGAGLVRMEGLGREGLYRSEPPLTREKVLAMELHLLAIRPGVEGRALELLNAYKRKEVTRAECVESINAEIQAVNASLMSFTGLSYGAGLTEAHGTMTAGLLTYRDFLRALRDFVRVDGADVFRKKLAWLEWRDTNGFARHLREVKDPSTFTAVAPQFIRDLVVGEIEYGNNVLAAVMRRLGVSPYTSGD
jgi:hypothetical protein